MKIGGKYRIYETLGNGAFGKTHKVTSFRESFAMKEIAISATLDDDGVNKELEAFENLPRHENVVTQIHHFTENSNIYVVFDFYEPGNLNDFAISEKLDGVAVFRTLKDVVHGLQHLHKHGVTHGNLKPQNLLMEMSHGNKPVFKISDFNLTRYATSSDSRLTTMASNKPIASYIESDCGLALFWAPEFKDGHFEKAGDVFSVGVVVYALFQMRVDKKVICPVIKTTSGDELPLFLSCQDDTEAAVKQLVSPNLSSIVCSMLSVSPASRPTVDEVAATFR